VTPLLVLVAVLSGGATPEQDCHALALSTKAHACGDIVLAGAVERCARRDEVGTRYRSCLLSATSCPDLQSPRCNPHSPTTGIYEDAVSLKKRTAECAKTCGAGDDHKDRDCRRQCMSASFKKAVILKRPTIRMKTAAPGAKIERRCDGACMAGVETCGALPACNSKCARGGAPFADALIAATGRGGSCQTIMKLIGAAK